MSGRLLFHLAQTLRRSRRMGVLREIAGAPFAPPEEVRANQWRRLAALLAHAEARVPYYREMFRSLRIGARDVRTPEDFARLPVLTKADVRERLQDMVRDDVPLATLSPHHSGGSTGVPLRFYRDTAYTDASEAGQMRSFLQCGWRPGEMIAFFWGGNERLYRMPGWEFELRQALRRMYQFDPFHSGPQEMDRWLAKWRRVAPAVAFGYASTVARFAAHIRASGRSVPPLKGVFTTAEKLYAPQRAAIAETFGCRVYDCYGSSEVQNIAAECPAGSMHVNADFVVVETEPDAGAGPAPLLLTSLWNYSMPFIRYRNEDCGELVPGECGCGNHFPLMRLNIARISDNFTLPGGRVVHGEFFTHLMYGSAGVATFQFHQTAPDRIVLWIVPAPGDPVMRERSVRSAVQQVERIAAGVAVEVRETAAIPLSAAGKHRFTRSDVPPATNGAAGGGA